MDKVGSDNCDTRYEGLLRNRPTRMEFGLVEKLDASCGMRMRNNNTEPQDNVQGADWVAFLELGCGWD